MHIGQRQVRIAADRFADKFVADTGITDINHAIQIGGEIAQQTIGQLGAIDGQHAFVVDPQQNFITRARHLGQEFSLILHPPQPLDQTDTQQINRQMAGNRDEIVAVEVGQHFKRRHKIKIECEQADQHHHQRRPESEEKLGQDDRDNKKQVRQIGADKGLDPALNDKCHQERQNRHPVAPTAARCPASGIAYFHENSEHIKRCVALGKKASAPESTGFYRSKNGVTTTK